METARLLNRLGAKSCASQPSRLDWSRLDNFERGWSGVRALVWVLALPACGPRASFPAYERAWISRGRQRRPADHHQSAAFALPLTSLSLWLRGPLMRLYADRIGSLSPEHVRVVTVVAGALLGILVSLSSVGAGALGVTVLLFLYPEIGIGTGIDPHFLAATTMISTRFGGRASAAETVARAGVLPGATHASQTLFISSKLRMSASQMLADRINALSLFA